MPVKYVAMKGVRENKDELKKKLTGNVMERIEEKKERTGIRTRWKPRSSKL